MFAVLGCSPSDESIRKDIEEARACTSTEDCVNVGTTCPFGCDIVVNRTEAARIASILAEYDSNCDYECVELAGIDCVEQRCTALRR